MSSNQKQAATGGPQTQRYSTSPYQCIPQPNNRADGFPVSTPPGSYVSSQPNQGGNQGPGLRNIASTGPPNQASTPPNSDIKVQTLPQPSMSSMLYQQQVRPAQGSYYSRTAVPPSQTPRMPNHSNRPQQQIYGTQPPPQYVVPQMYIASTNSVPFYNTSGQRPPGFVQQSIPLYTGPHITYNPAAYAAAAAAQSQTPFNYYQMIRNPISQQPQPNPNPAQQPTISSVPLVNSVAPSQPVVFQQRPANKRRPNAISVIDPDTGADRLNEIFEEGSHPPSGESSARQTPQPPPNSHNKEVQAAFAKQVMQAISTDLEHAPIEDLDHQELPMDHIEQNMYPLPTHPIVHTSKIEHLVQSSNLQALAKEFISKETPVVSANCDAIEVTLPNKLPKDRDSPVKGRKQPREPPVREHRDSIVQQEVTVNKDSISDKQSSIIKDAKIKPPPTNEVSFSNNATNISQIPVADEETVVENAINETQEQVKESKNESNSIVIETCETVRVSPVPEPASPPVQDVSNSGKSKQNAQRGASKQGAPQGTTQKPAQASVPQSQPAKASNKSHKKSEINLKGANKEGTDMDAFNDNIVQELNANVTSSSVVTSNSTNNDIINANLIPVTNNVAPTREINVSETNNRKFESNEMTIKSEPLKPVKTKVDITDIVKEKPKILKPYISPTDGQDEPDKALISNDKLVQAKNEVNAKVNDANRNDNKIQYKEGQWSPDNPNGDRVYQRDFLISLRDCSISRKVPDNIPDAIAADDRGGLSDGRLSMGGRTDFTNIPFNNYGGGKSHSQRGVPPKRNSQSKMTASGGKSTKTVMKYSLSVREDVKLHETENAWKPARLKKGENASSDDKKTADLYKKVRGVLNKLTPQKFNTLLSQIKALQIDTTERLQGVIDLVFEKAVDEPNFSVAYALMCSELALMQVPTSNSTEEKPDYVNFRKLLITRCQVEFEKQSVDESTRNIKVKEIEECTDPEKKKDLQFELEEHDRRLRMKSVGNIRFIGELFKQNMLTVNIMMRCLTNLLDNKDEESLECLCKLLTTIGKELEMKNLDLFPIISTMKNIVNKKEGKVSSRIRFMLQDVIDLKYSKWIPRRQDLNPKTIDQIQKEADNEQLNIQIMNSTPMSNRKDDRGGSGSNSDRKGRGRNAPAGDGWVMNTNRARTTTSNTFLINRDKLNLLPPNINEPLGSQSSYSNWAKGSVGASNKAPTSQLGTTTTNMYAPLENIEPPEKHNMNSRLSNKDPYHSKGPSLERNYNNKYKDDRSSRSGSQQRSSETSAPLPQRSTPAPVLPPAAPKIVESVPLQRLTDEMERRLFSSLDEYIGGYCTVEECIADIGFGAAVYPKMVESCYLHVLEKTKPARLKTGSLFAILIKLGDIQVEQYCAGLEEFLSQADDLKIDIPKIWDYLAECLLELVTAEALSLSRLHKSFHLLIDQGHARKVLAPLFKLLVAETGPNFLENIWQKSDLKLTDFMDISEVDSFVQDNQLELLVGGSSPVGQNKLTYEDIQSKLSELLKANAPYDHIFNWISANVEDIEGNKFIRALATAIFEDSIGVNRKLSPETLAKHGTLLFKYIDGNPERELQCLYALQALVNRLEHPSGLLLSICDELYEKELLTQESFIAWEISDDPAEQVDKGVALKQLLSFFTRLKENDEDSSSSEEAAGSEEAPVSGKASGSEGA